MRRILVLAPHPDDEVVGAGAATLRARAEGARVFCLYLTTGVPAREVLFPWQRSSHGAKVARRRAEAVAAARLLGLEPIGFQDWPTRTLKARLGEAEALVAAAVERHGIGTLWVPAWEGAHQDHDVANALAARFRDRVEVFELAEYNFAGAAVRSQRFVAANGRETVLDLTPAERELKRRALAIYASEAGNLRHVGLERETMRPLPAHDYARAPHAGKLFWQRFQWIPFRHPRVDFERPETVLRALSAWASAAPASPGRNGPRSTPRSSGDGGR